MDDVKFGSLILEVKDMLSDAQYESAMDSDSTYYLGRFAALEQVVELLEDDKWK